MNTHFQISASLPANDTEKLSDIFLEIGALAITMTDAKDEPLFQLGVDDNPLWQHTTIQALFDTSHSAECIVEDIKKTHAEFAPVNFYIENVENINWVKETQKQFQAQQFGDLWICPQWQKQDWKKLHDSKKNPVVFLEPGLAFGTGTHPTTQLCLMWLATHPLQNKVVIDYGCGSGILALGALAMHAKAVYATDHDSQALIATKNNEKYNRFKQSLVTVKTHEVNDVRAHIIVANILVNALIDLKNTFYPLLLSGGQLILSGILQEDESRILEAYADNFAYVSTEHKDGWVLMAFAKR